MFNTTVAASWPYHMDATSDPAEPAEMTDANLGLGGGMTGVAKRVAYTVGKRVRYRCTSVPHLMLVLTDAAFEFRSLWREWMVVCVGSPSISGIASFSKLLTSLLTEVDAMMGGEELINS